MSAKEEPLSEDYSSSSLSQRFHEAQSLLVDDDAESSGASSGSEHSIEKAINLLQQLQQDIASLGLFSSNETLQDVSTPSLELVAVEFCLAQAYLQRPASAVRDDAIQRKANLQQSQVYLESFLNKLISLEGDLLSEQQVKDYHALLESSSSLNDPDDETSTTRGMRIPTRISRDEKIAKFRAKQQLEKDIDRLRSLQQRRGRLGLESTEELDGLDAELLQRTLLLQRLKLLASTAIEEWQQSMQEFPMIDTMIRRSMEATDERAITDQQRRHYGGTGGKQQDDNHVSNEQRQQPNSNSKPFQLTHITKDSLTGHLQIRKEQLKSQVFRPGWNQPTMSLQELGERELLEAQARAERQKQAEEDAKNAPRRYEQLLRDGMEDNADLVDASAKLDREWDEFREANPRGSGNKMGDRGDRNF